MQSVPKKWAHLGCCARNTYSSINKRVGRGEKALKREPDIGGYAEEGALLMFGCLLALLEVEDAIMQRAIPDTSKRAQVLFL